MEVIMSSLESQTNNFNSEVEKFGMRWYQMRPREDQLEGEMDVQSSIAFITEKRLEWDQLMEMRDRLKWVFAFSNLLPYSVIVSLWILIFIIILIKQREESWNIWRCLLVEVLKMFMLQHGLSKDSF